MILNKNLTTMENKRIPAFIINLKDSTRRKTYMENVLNPYNSFLKLNFVEAVDGRKYSKEQLWISGSKRRLSRNMAVT